MKPSASRVAERHAAKYGVTMQVGDIVKVKTSRMGWVQAIVAEVEHNYRATKWPYTVRTVTDDGQDFRGKRKSNLYADPGNQRIMQYVGRSRKKKILDESVQRKRDSEKVRQDRADDGAALLRSWDLKEGDVIYYKYRNGSKHEVVRSVNYSTGKVGIERFSEFQKADYLKLLKDRKDRADELEYLYGIRGRRPSNRSVRWLPAKGIKKVVSRAR
jgi:hypothetical protein